MSTIPQPEKQATISFRCPEEFWKKVKKAAIDRNVSIQKLCTSLIAEGLGIEVPEATDVPA